MESVHYVASLLLRIIIFLSTWNIIISISPGNIIVKPGTALVIICDNPATDGITAYNIFYTVLKSCNKIAGSFSHCTDAEYTFGSSSMAINSVPLGGIVRCSLNAAPPEMMMIITAENVLCSEDQTVEVGSTVNLTCTLSYSMYYDNDTSIVYLPFLSWKDDYNQTLAVVDDSTTPGTDIEHSYTITAMRSATYTCEAYFTDENLPSKSYPIYDDTIPMFPAGTDRCEVNIIVYEPTTTKPSKVGETTGSQIDTVAPVVQTTSAIPSVSNTDVTINAKDGSGTTTTTTTTTVTTTTVPGWHNAYFLTVVVACAGLLLTLKNLYQTIDTTGFAYIEFQQQRMAFDWLQIYYRRYPAYITRNSFLRRGYRSKFARRRKRVMNRRRYFQQRIDYPFYM